MLDDLMRVYEMGEEQLCAELDSNPYIGCDECCDDIWDF